MHVTVTHTAQNTAKIASKYREHVLTVHMRNRAHTLVFIWGRLLFLSAGISLTALRTSAKFGGLFSDAKWSRKNVSSSCDQAVLCPKYAQHKLNNIIINLATTVQTTTKPRNHCTFKWDRKGICRQEYKPIHSCSTLPGGKNQWHYFERTCYGNVCNWQQSPTVYETSHTLHWRTLILVR